MTSKITLLKRFVNSFLSPNIHGLFNKKKAFSVNTEPNKLNLLYQKITSRLWFFPSMYTSKFWVGAKQGGDRGYTTFMKIDDRATFLIENLKRLIEDKNMPILDIGCNIGRFLNVLSEHGCNNLTGIDINQLAIDDSFNVYPSLVDSARMKCDTIQGFLSNASDNEFDLIYTYGATVELVHPTFPLVRNLARVSNKFVCLYISEEHKYPRFWESEFKRNSFELLLKAPYSYWNHKGSSNQVLYIFRKVR